MCGLGEEVACGYRHGVFFGGVARRGPGLTKGALYRIKSPHRATAMLYLLTIDHHYAATAMATFLGTGRLGPRSSLAAGRRHALCHVFRRSVDADHKAPLEEDDEPPTSQRIPPTP